MNDISRKTTQDELAYRLTFGRPYDPGRWWRSAGEDGIIIEANLNSSEDPNLIGWRWGRPWTEIPSPTPNAG